MPALGLPQGPGAVQPTSPATPLAGNARTGQMQIRPYTPPVQRQRQPFTTSQIQDYVLGQGWASPNAAGPGQGWNTRAIYDAGQNNHVSAAQFDAAGGFSPGTTAKYVADQGWDPLRGRQGDATTGPIGFRPPPGGAPSSFLPNDPRVGMQTQPRDGEALTNALYNRRFGR